MPSNTLLYLDNASTTKINPEILKTYTYLLNNYFANSSALYPIALEVRRLEDKARSEILGLFKLKNYRLIFTSGASEANNLAIKALAIKYQDQGKHLITTKIEHPSVYNSFKFLEEYLDFKVTYLDVDINGQIDLKQLKQSLTDQTLLVSIMGVNNELGTIINPKAWTKIVKANSKAFTHSDMVQALGHVEIDFDNLDLISFSAHKIGGLKGSGMLLMRDYLQLAPLISGGDQEYGVRGGTQDSAANIVLAKTVRLALENQAKNANKLSALKSYTFDKLKTINAVIIHTPLDKSVNHIINFSVKGVNSEIMLNALSKYAIYVSAGSTCQSDLYTDSRVLSSIYVDKTLQKSRIRISLSTDLSEVDIDYFIDKLKETIENYAI